MVKLLELKLPIAKQVEKVIVNAKESYSCYGWLRAANKGMIEKVCHRLFRSLYQVSEPIRLREVQLGTDALEMELTWR